GRRTLEIRSDGTRADHENAGPDEPESPSEPARRDYVRVAREVKQKKRALCALSAGRGRRLAAVAGAQRLIDVRRRVTAGRHCGLQLAARAADVDGRGPLDVLLRGEGVDVARSRLRGGAVDVVPPLGEVEAVDAGGDERHLPAGQPAGFL